MPTRNVKDLIEIPRKARSEMKIVPVEHMDQVLEVALGPQPVIEEPDPPKRSHSRRKKNEEAVPAPDAEIQGNPAPQEQVK
jgi:ATP-dependent Lon protease